MRKLHPYGPNGAGQTTNLVNQVLCAVGFQAVAEAVRLAEAGGVDAARIPAALAGSRADRRILQEFGPKMAERDYSPTGRIDNMLIDLEAVEAIDEALSSPRREAQNLRLNRCDIYTRDSIITTFIRN